MRDIVIDGLAHKMMLDIGAICKIEAALDSSMLVLARKLADGIISVGELVMVIECALVPGLGRSAIFELGITYITQLVTGAFVEAFSGEACASGDEQLTALVQQARQVEQSS